MRTETGPGLGHGTDTEIEERPQKEVGTPHGRVQVSEAGDLSRVAARQVCLHTHHGTLQFVWRPYEGSAEVVSTAPHFPRLCLQKVGKRGAGPE